MSIIEKTQQIQIWDFWWMIKKLCLVIPPMEKLEKLENDKQIILMNV